MTHNRESRRSSSPPELGAAPSPDGSTATCDPAAPAPVGERTAKVSNDTIFFDEDPQLFDDDEISGIAYISGTDG